MTSSVGVRIVYARRASRRRVKEAFGPLGSAGASTSTPPRYTSVEFARSAIAPPCPSPDDQRDPASWGAGFRVVPIIPRGRTQCQGTRWACLLYTSDAADERS